MLTGGAHRYRDEIASLLGWWAEAGLDAGIAERPVDWLAPPPAPATPTAAAVPALPRDLAAFRALLATGAYLPDAPPAGRRIAATGPAGAALMVVTDMPDEADLRARRLLDVEAALFDAMLRAMGTTRDAICLAPLSPARLTGGRLGAAAAPLADLMRVHIALVRPRALLVLGDETARALLGTDRASASLSLRPVNHDSGSVPAIAAIHPRILRPTPALKADAWRAMRLLIGVLTS